jgi:hypothetical protein
MRRRVSGRRMIEKRSMILTAQRSASFPQAPTSKEKKIALRITAGKRYANEAVA